MTKSIEATSPYSPAANATCSRLGRLGQKTT